MAGGAFAIALLVYAITNPYVPFNFIFHRVVLESNLGNSKAMYHANLTMNGIENAAYLIAAGTSPLLMLAGVIATAALAIRAVRVRQNRDEAEIRRRTTGLLLAIPAIVITVQCLFFAVNKPGEFGRFMLLPDIFLLIEVMVALGTQWHGLPASEDSTQEIVQGRLKSWAGSPCHWGGGLLVVATALSGLSYLRAFTLDSRSSTSRLIEAKRLVSLNPRNSTTRWQPTPTPAPYCLPPMDLFDDRIILLPKDAGLGEGLKIADVSVRAVDVPGEDRNWLRLFTTTPISWANKPFDVRTRK